MKPRASVFCQYCFRPKRSSFSGVDDAIAVDDPAKSRTPGNRNLPKRLPWGQASSAGQEIVGIMKSSDPSANSSKKREPKAVKGTDLWGDLDFPGTYKVLSHLRAIIYLALTKLNGIWQNGL